MGGRMTDHEPTALDKLDTITEEIQELAALAEETDNQPALQEFTRRWPRSTKPRRGSGKPATTPTPATPSRPSSRRPVRPQTR